MEGKNNRDNPRSVHIAAGPTRREALMSAAATAAVPAARNAEQAASCLEWAAAAFMSRLAR